MRVVTYNLHKGKGRRQRAILDRAADALALLRPDVLLCQEVFHGTSEGAQQCRRLSDALGHAHVFGPNAFYAGGCHGNATFARHSVVTHENFDATHSRFERRGLLHTQIDGPHGAIVVMNVHLSLTARQRRRQWQQVLAALPEDPTKPAVVCGDFNDWSAALDRGIRRSGVLRNALWALPPFERSTFPARHALLALDRIYVRGLRVRSVRVLRGAPWDELSDHLPVEAWLEPER